MVTDFEKLITLEEINLMCVFFLKSRMELIEDIGRVLPHLKESEMEECSWLIKKHNITKQGQPAPPLFRTAEVR